MAKNIKSLLTLQLYPKNANVTDLTYMVFEGFKELNSELCSIFGYDMQWMIAILLFFLKKISSSMMVKYLTKVSSSETLGVAKGIVTVENGVIFKLDHLFLY